LPGRKAGQLTQARQQVAGAQSNAAKRDALLKRAREQIAASMLSNGRAPEVKAETSLLTHDARARPPSLEAQRHGDQPEQDE
jgi:hypothetical protein